MLQTLFRQTTQMEIDCLYCLKCISLRYLQSFVCGVHKHMVHFATMEKLLCKFMKLRQEQ